MIRCARCNGCISGDPCPYCGYPGAETRRPEQIRTSAQQVLQNEIALGAACQKCHELLEEDHGEPTDCQKCGGEGVLM